MTLRRAGEASRRPSGTAVVTFSSPTSPGRPRRRALDRRTSASSGRALRVDPCESSGSGHDREVRRRRQCSRVRIPQAHETTPNGRFGPPRGAESSFLTDRVGRTAPTLGYDRRQHGRGGRRPRSRSTRRADGQRRRRQRGRTAATARRAGEVLVGGHRRRPSRTIKYREARGSRGEGKSEPVPPGWPLPLLVTRTCDAGIAGLERAAGRPKPTELAILSAVPRGRARARASARTLSVRRGGKSRLLAELVERLPDAAW